MNSPKLISALQRKGVPQSLIDMARTASRTTAEVREAIDRFNDKNPNRAIKPMQLAQSMRMRLKRIEQAESGVYLPNRRRQELPP